MTDVTLNASRKGDEAGGLKEMCNNWRGSRKQALILNVSIVASVPSLGFLVCVLERESKQIKGE